MKGHDAIHLKIDYLGALESKKNLLNSEKSLMMAAKSIHSYSSRRKKEVKKRVTLARKFRELGTLLKKMHKDMPEAGIPRVAGHHAESGLGKISTTRQASPAKAGKQDSNIESQLQEIQRKLNEIAK